MAYLTINKAADSGLYVVGSIRRYKDTVHQNIMEQQPQPGSELPGSELSGSELSGSEQTVLQKTLAEITTPRFDEMLAFMADDLDESRIEMVNDLELYLHEITGDATSTVERGEAVADMRYWYQFARDHTANSCGEARTREMGFDMQTEQHPWRLERQGQRAINFFKGRDPEAQIEADNPEKQEGALTNGYIVRVLEPRHSRLADVLATWIQTRRGTEEALIRKDASLAAYEQKFSTHAKCAEMLYRWAGLEEEAKRIKPSVRRPGQRAVVADGSESPDAPSTPDPSVTPDPVDP